MTVEISIMHRFILALLLLSPMATCKKARIAASWAPPPPTHEIPPPPPVKAAAVAAAAVLVQLPLPGSCSIRSLAINVIEPSLNSLFSANSSANSTTALQSQVQSQSLTQLQSQSSSATTSASLAVNSSQITTTVRSTSTSTATVIQDLATAVASIATSQLLTKASYSTNIRPPSITSTSASFAPQPSSSAPSFASTTANPTTNTTTTTTTATKSCVADFSVHNKLTDCYVLHSGLVYDLTSWIPKHPGGKNVYTGLCGVSGSVFDDAFKGKHGTGKDGQMVGESKIVGDGSVCSTGNLVQTTSTGTSNTATGTVGGGAAGSTGTGISTANLDVTSFAIQYAGGNGRVGGLLLAVLCCFVL